jgi:hypothetical protein
MKKNSDYSHAPVETRSFGTDMNRPEDGYVWRSACRIKQMPKLRSEFSVGHFSLWHHTKTSLF